MTEKVENARWHISLILEDQTLAFNNSDILECYIIEDIYSFSMTGKILFIDKLNVMEFGPMNGNEKIQIVFEDGREEKAFEFYIYKIGRVSQASMTNVGAERIIEMYLVDSSFLAMNIPKYSVSWKETLISDIVKDMMKNMIGITKFEQFEDSNEELEYFYMPYWNVNDSIKWLSKRATGNESGGAGYLLYQNNLGFNFVTLEKLLQNSEKEDENYILSPKEDSDNENVVLSWNLNGIDGTSFRTLSGGLRLGFDFKKKKLITKKYKYKDSIPEFTILGKKSLFRDITVQNVDIKLTGESDEDMIDNIYYNDWIKKYCLQNVVNINVIGNSIRHAGNMIEIEWISDIENEIFNKAMTGKYLIKSITHYFSGQDNISFRQRLVCIKNGYEDVQTETLMPSVKFNISTGNEIIS